MDNKIPWAKRYYRFQEDRQVVIGRNEEQKKIFDEYFVIENVATGKTPLLVAGLILLVIGIILAAVGANTAGLLVGGILAAVVGIILLIVYKTNKTYKPKAVMTDEEYEQLVSEKIAGMDVPKMGMERLGLDADQIREIRPIVLRDKVITDTSLEVYNRENGSLHSSTQYVVVLYFTDEQLLAYKLQFDMCCNLRDEWTSEFFYRDICDISSRMEKNILTVGDLKFEYSSTEVEIVSTNSRIGFVLGANNPAAASVQAMKQKIRERKQL